MDVRRAIHAHLPLLAKNIYIHRLQDIPESSVQTDKDDQGRGPSKVPTKDQAKQKRSDQPNRPVSIDRLDVLQRRLLFLDSRIAYPTDPLAVVAAILISALQDRLIGTQMSPASVAKEAAAFGAVISVGVNLAATDRALRDVP
jgi:hypothetical protein